MKKFAFTIAVIVILFTSCEKHNIEVLKHPEIKDRVQPDTIEKVILN
ncbi:hypothetical protein BN1088_1431996 [Sphingobacterium sp. PM2-P1-29]|nr:hypothetical protein BN1088_1431996 [Sphingobacterium sp. PM2-P1-29]